MLVPAVLPLGGVRGEDITGLPEGFTFDDGFVFARVGFSPVADPADVDDVSQDPP